MRLTMRSRFSTSFCLSLLGSVAIFSELDGRFELRLRLFPHAEFLQVRTNCADHPANHGNIVNQPQEWDHVRDQVNRAEKINDRAGRENYGVPGHFAIAS